MPTAASATPAPSPTDLHLLSSQVEGQRILVSQDTTAFRLGKMPALRNLLKANGAVQLSQYELESGIGFHLLGCRVQYLEGFSAGRAPLRFEDELCAPGPPGWWVEFKARLFELVRELCRHSLVVVRRFSYGPPTPEAELLAAEQRLGRPLPRRLRELYQHLGPVQLLWNFRAPVKATWPEPAPPTALNPDLHDAYDGVLNLLPLAELLNDKWLKPAHHLALTAARRPLDVYGPGSAGLVAVELGPDDDPWVNQNPADGHPDEPVPLRFSAYLDLLLATYGQKRPQRLASPPEPPLDLDNQDSLQTQADFNQSLDIVGWQYDRLRQAPAAAAPFFDLLRVALAKPGFSIDAYFDFARRIGSGGHGLLRTPRFAALRARPVGASLTRYGQHPPFDQQLSEGTFRVFNYQDASLTVRDCLLQVLSILDGQDVELQRVELTAGPDRPHSAFPDLELPLTLAAGTDAEVRFSLHDADLQAALLPYGIRSLPAFLGRSTRNRLRLTVYPDQGPPLTDEYDYTDWITWMAREQERRRQPRPA